MSMATLAGKPIPKPLLDIIVRVRDRVKELKEKYETLGKYGLPYFEDATEIAVVYYVNAFCDIGLNEIANFLNVDKTSLYKLKQRIENGEEVSYYDREEGRTKKIKLSVEDIEKIISDLIQPSSKREIKDIYESSTIQEFLRNPARITKSGRYTKYSSHQVKEVLRTVAKIIEYIKRKELDIPTNPDFWTKNIEDKLSEAIYGMCRERYGDEVHIRRCRYRTMTVLRRIQRFYNEKIFEGMIGAVTKTVKPVIEKETIEDYETYLKIKNIYINPPNEWSEKEINTFRAWFEIARLHILLGCREGYGSIYAEADRLKSIGIEQISGFNLNNVFSMDLDDVAVILGTSLLGLKWQDISFDPFMMRIYERKTGDEWILSYNWLDDDIPNTLKRIRESTKDIVRYSVIKSILVYYGINIKSVESFRIWYSEKTKKYGKIIGFEKLSPHRLRSAHISLLAYLGVPLEIAVSKQSGLGVGWNEIGTAIHFYWKISQKRVREYIDSAIKSRKSIEQNIK